MSNYTAERLTQALEISRRLGLPRYECLQPHHNLCERADYETKLEPVCLAHGIGVITYWSNLARADVDPEAAHQPWCNHVLRRRLHSSPNGDFAAVVNDYGRYGQIIDLRNGKITLALDGGDYHSETVPFSFAFAIIKGWLVAIHRTSWNIALLVNPYTDVISFHLYKLQAGRRSAVFSDYLDYFHAPCTRLRPGGIRTMGWVWQLVGMPRAWSLENWMSDNVESEAVPPQKSFVAAYTTRDLRQLCP